jgi:hypothetical protein
MKDSKRARDWATFLWDLLVMPFSTLAVILVATVFWVERLFGAGMPKRNRDRRHRMLSIASENWARGLWVTLSEGEERGSGSDALLPFFNHGMARWLALRAL